MSSIHEQAMNYVYQQVLQRVLSYFKRAERTALQLLIQRLIVAAGGIECIGSFKVLVAFSGGKDSAYTVALLRAAQLSIAGRSPATFNLRIANMRHTGMTPAVMENIQRTYSALFLHDDPRVELLVVENQSVSLFEPSTPLSDACRQQNRSDVLLNGHLSAGDGRTTFCNSCYLAIADFFERATTWRGGVDAVVSGDSRREQKQYMTWVMRLASPAIRRTSDTGSQNFNSMLSMIGRISQAYHQELYGDPNVLPETIAATDAGNRSCGPAFIPIADLIVGDTDEHWKLLTEFLDFRFDDLAFSFSESDCANPLLMAHMRGLKVEYVQGRRYAEGVAEYLQLAKVLMRRKRMPEHLIDKAMSAYADDERIQQRRDLAATYAQESFGLSEPQLICLLFSPFVHEGKELERFLRRLHPGMLVALPDLHRGLQGLAVPEQVQQWLVDISGLTLQGLQGLYRKRSVDFTDPASLIARVRAADPDKRQIMTFDPASGERSPEIISGR